MLRGDGSWNPAKETDAAGPTPRSGATTNGYSACSARLRSSRVAVSTGGRGPSRKGRKGRKGRKDGKDGKDGKERKERKR